MTKAPISGRMAAILAAVSALALLGLVLLYAFAPALSAGGSADADALSRSAIGFAGLKDLLTLSGIPADIDRGRGSHSSRRPSLTILTPPLGMPGVRLAVYRADSPLLIILRKWAVLPIPTHTAWVAKQGAFPTDLIQGQIANVLGTATVLRVNGSTHQLDANLGPGALPGLTAPHLGHIEELQTLLGGTALLTSGHGVLLTRSKRPGFPVYVLAEPDLMNNQGLADQANAAAALNIIASLRFGQGPVRMDVTLDGLSLAPSFLRALFEPPFLGATICALAAALLMGVHAAFRFGAPIRPMRIFARGKKALADNSADLVRMMGREGAMAPRYVAAARNLVLERLGTRRSTPEAEDALLATLARVSGTEISYSELEREAAAASSGGDLLLVARKTYQWRRRISGGHQ